MNIKDGAIFIADSHYNSQRTILLDLLTKINLKDIQTKQIFFMGDIFDFLASEIEYFRDINYEIINIINNLSLDIEIIYFEGNHDFNLEDIFPKIHIISREQQPLEILQDNKSISLAHGDIFTPTAYNIFTSIFRNHYFLLFLNFIDKNNWLSLKLEKIQMLKNICHKQKDFTQFIENRIQDYDTDLIIEGHFHQGYQDERYINLPSLACDDGYMIFKDSQFTFHYHN